MFKFSVSVVVESLGLISINLLENVLEKQIIFFRDHSQWSFLFNLILWDNLALSDNNGETLIETLLLRFSKSGVKQLYPGNMKRYIYY